MSPGAVTVPLRVIFDVPAADPTVIAVVEPDAPLVPMLIVFVLPEDVVPPPIEIVFVRVVASPIEI
jgi:hypothetical protein